MSIQYRRPRDNMYLTATDPATSTGQAPPDSERDWLSSRRARPLNQLLPATRRWAEALPGIAPPANLLRDFPRIANRVAHEWNDPVAARAILDDLLIDRRGGRHGFPPAVLSELLTLKSILDGIYRSTLWR